jgi:hypothetical protein
MPTFAISNDRGYLKVNLDFTFNWSQTDFNKYPSKYAAKKHLKELDNVPEDVKVVLVLTE